MKAARVLALVLQVLAAANAQHVHGANGALTSERNQTLRLETGSGSTNGSHAVVGDDVSVVKHAGDCDKAKFFGGRRNSSIPSLGKYRRNVALLLQTREEESDQLQGCITVAIAPRFFLTRASCVRDQSNAPVLFIESTDKNGVVSRQPLKVNTTTPHPDFAVNLAIVEVDDHDDMLSKTVKPIQLSAYAASYYRQDGSLSLVSIDNIFNPSLAMNARAINKLVRVPANSCQYNADPSTIHCFAPGDFAARKQIFEFGQGMLVHNSQVQSLVGLPDCEGLCSGGMFYSTTHLAPHKSWIDDITGKSAQWMALKKQIATFAVPIEQEPTYVSLYASLHQDAEPVCAGSLIAPRHILTTASCTTKHVLSLARMNHGERTDGLNGHEDTIPVTKITVHPQYANTTKFSNDLAVIELGGPTIYTPTILASDDTLDLDVNGDAVGCHNPRRSSVDHSIMCLPPRPSDDVGIEDAGLERKLQEDLSLSSSEDGAFTTVDLDLLDVGTFPGSSCEPKTIEQWNRLAGDSVFEVPSSGSYYLLGLTTGLLDTTVQVRSANQTDELHRMCSLNETVGDDDSAALAIRLATPETMEFIDAASVDHTWRDPHALPFSIFASKRMVVNGDASMNAASFSIAYDGELVFEQPPTDMDLGFVVGLRFEKFGQNYCGGSLIAPSYVLTAAHCVAGDRAKFVSVGSHESKGTETEVITVKSTNIITHPKYGKRSLYSYDVAILELDSQAYPKPIVLDNSRELDASMYLTLFGYGANSASSTTLSEVLRSVDLPYFPRDTCMAKFPELDESMFCAGGELARDACTGDSGSPLVRIANGQPRLVGVVSSGRNGCGTPGVPGVYALVATVQDFIDNVVAGNKWVDPNQRSASSMGISSVGAGAGGSSGSGRGLDAPAEARAADGTVVRRDGDSSETNEPFDRIYRANGAVDHQLSIVEMAADTPRGLQAALMEFLVGDYNNILGWRPEVDEHWKAVFYSTGDLNGLMNIIATHRAEPLYSRTNRFARPAWGEPSSDHDGTVVSRGAACASGH